MRSAAFAAPASSLEFVQFWLPPGSERTGWPRLPAGPLEGTRASRPAGKPPIAVIAPRAPSA